MRSGDDLGWYAKGTDVASVTLSGLRADAYVGPAGTVSFKGVVSR